MFDQLVPPDLLSQITQAHRLQFTRMSTVFKTPGLASLTAAASQSVSSALRASGGGGFGGFGGEYEVIPGRPGRPAKYAPDKPPEKFLAHLRRLGWIQRDSRKRYSVTPLGHALLKAETLSGPNDDEAVVVLAANDVLAYGHVMGVIAECGEALIVDGYLDAQELVHILSDSNATRFLVSEKLGKGRLTALALLIRLSPPNDNGVERELRRATVHDRYVIGDNRVFGLGSSLNTVGKKGTTTLVQMPDTAAQMIRAENEDLWREGQVVAFSGQFDPADEPKPEDLSSDGEALPNEGVPASDDVNAVDGSSNHAKSRSAGSAAYGHPGCSVRHRTQEAADRCRNGIGTP